jgi:hypothetical protein
MIRTEYTRMVPINIRFPDLGVVTTGHRLQRAWRGDSAASFGRPKLYDKEIAALLLGQEAEGFEWRDEPVAP